MTAAFDKEYAGVYDALYADKNYESECAAIEKLWTRHARRPVASILDVGCGTGAHAVRFLKRGYRVVGVDLSESMLEGAAEKAQANGVELETHVQDARNLDLGRTFDAALLMFAVLGYQYENDDVAATLASCRRHLRPGGLLTFDVWYGPGVLTERPGERVKQVETDDGAVLRAASANLDTLRNRCTVSYRIWNLPAGEPATMFSEAHTLRYFFVPELECFLQQAGFELVQLGAFPDADREPQPTDWNVIAVARAL